MQTDRSHEKTTTTALDFETCTLLTLSFRCRNAVLPAKNFGKAVPVRSGKIEAWSNKPAGTFQTKNWG